MSVINTQQKDKRSSTKVSLRPLPVPPRKQSDATAPSPVPSPIPSPQDSKKETKSEAEFLINSSSPSPTNTKINSEIKLESKESSPITKLEEKEVEQVKPILNPTVIENHFFGGETDFQELTKEENPKPKPVTRPRRNNNVIAFSTKEPETKEETKKTSDEKLEKLEEKLEKEENEPKINDFEEIPLKKESAISKIGKKKKKENNPLLDNYIKKLVEIPKRPTSDVQIIDLLQDLIPPSRYDSPIVIYKLVSIEDILKGISHTEVKEFFKIKK